MQSQTYAAENESKRDHLQNCENGWNARDLQPRQDYPDRKEQRIFKQRSGQIQKNTGQDGSKGRLYRGEQKEISNHRLQSRQF